MILRKLLISILFTFSAAHAYAKKPNPSTADIRGNTYLGVIGNKVTISFGGQICTLESIGKNGKEGEAPLDFKINFQCGKVIQTIWDIKKLGPDDFSFDDPKFELLKAGDFDGDKKIDLEMDLSPKYSCEKIVKLESKKAQANELVGVSGTPTTQCGE